VISVERRPGPSRFLVAEIARQSEVDWIYLADLTPKLFDANQASGNAWVLSAVLSAFDQGQCRNPPIEYFLLKWRISS
jgi:hypothetical protein